MRISAIAILVALFLLPAAVFGQSQEVMDAHNRVNELYSEGRYQKAINKLKLTGRLRPGPLHWVGAARRE